MASIVKLGKGKQPIRAIDFIAIDGKRKRVRLGTVTHEQAETAELSVTTFWTFLRELSTG